MLKTILTKLDTTFDNPNMESKIHKKHMHLCNIKIMKFHRYYMIMFGPFIPLLNP